jgi:hypothetical protein
MSSRMRVIVKVRSQHPPEDPARARRSHDPDILGVSSRLAVPHRHSAKVSAERKAPPRFPAIGQRCETSAVVAVAIAYQKPRRRVPGKRLQELLRGPLRGRMAGDREVYRPAAVVGKDYEHKQQPEGSRRELRRNRRRRDPGRDCSRRYATSGKAGAGAAPCAWRRLSPKHLMPSLPSSP